MLAGLDATHWPQPGSVGDSPSLRKRTALAWRWVSIWTVAALSCIVPPHVSRIQPSVQIGTSGSFSRIYAGIASGRASNEGRASRPGLSWKTDCRVCESWGRDRMPPTNSSQIATSTGGGFLRGLVLPVVFVGAILVFVVPIPASVLDVLLSANLTVAVVVLLTTLAIHTPQEFSSFPTILLTTTLTRLVLNVATARLVLTRGGIDGAEAAGDVIRAFGTFVAGDQVIVGVILFSIMVVIQFVVITQGATRISEVAARFTLDGLPGRQMAIDADLHAGLIDQHEAHRRRDEVYRQADFFGAMDGASRFIRGDAIAGVVILLVNIGGGLLLGIIHHGMSLGQAVDVFTKLTIGDGLVSQVPAFLTSLAAGLIVTRSSSSTDLSSDVVGQLFSHPGVLATAAVFLGLMALTPLPKIPLVILGLSMGAGSFVLSARRG